MSDTHDKVPAEISRHHMQAVNPFVEQSLKILRENPSPETLRELVELQREWEANEARKAYAVALSQLKTLLPSVIRRDKTVDFSTQKGRTHYRHASLSSILEQIEQPLTKLGFNLTWESDPDPDGKVVTVTCRLLHCAGHSESTKLSAPPDTSGNKNPIQAVGSTVSYLERYTALSLLGITTGDMPDADDAPTVDGREVAEKIAGMGLSISEAVEHVGCPVEDWRQEQVDALREWAKDKRGERKQEEADPDAEPLPWEGDDDDAG